jgi:3-hydroxybutyryl-CoA dehydratase
MLFEDIEIGQAAALKRSFSAEDVALFGSLSLDTNPVHFDEAYAQTTPFKQKIVHGMLVSSLVSAVLGTQLPGPGTIVARLELKFSKPVFYDEEVIAEAVVAEKIPRMKVVVMEVTCKKADGSVVLKGSATVTC